MVIEINLILRLQVAVNSVASGVPFPGTVPAQSYPRHSLWRRSHLLSFLTFLYLRNPHAFFPTAYETTSPHTHCLSIWEMLMSALQTLEWTSSSILSLLKYVFSSFLLFTRQSDLTIFCDPTKHCVLLSLHSIRSITLIILEMRLWGR